jgi:Sigma-70 region 2
VDHVRHRDVFHHEIQYFSDTPNRLNAHIMEVVSESGPAFEHRILGSAAEAQDIVQDVWLRWRSTDRSAVLDPRQLEVELFRCQVDGKRPNR